MRRTIISSSFLLLCGLPSLVSAASDPSALLVAKLPYEKGQSFIVTQGFHAPPTHIKDDDFAIDFTQSGCDAYTKSVVAAISGKAWVVEESGYNGGYGTQLLVISDGNVVTRYAHLVPDSVSVKIGEDILQGTSLGEVGNSGLVAGTACNIHPGTHLHFAMDTENADGSLMAKDPEPISGYSDIVEGNWYLSDNVLPADTVQKTDLTATLGATPDVASSNGAEISEGSVSGNDTSRASDADERGSGGQIAAPSNPGLAMGASVSQQGSGDPNSASFLANSLQTTSSSISSTQQIILPPNGASEPVEISSSPPAVGVMAISAQDDEASSSIASTSTAITSPQDTTFTGDFDGGTATSSQSTAASSSTASSSPFILDSPAVLNGSGSLALFNSSTVSVDIAWQPPQNASGSGPLTYEIFLINENGSGSTLIASTMSNSFSYAIPDADFGGDDSFALQAINVAGDRSALATSTIAIPSWFSAIQPVASDDSRPSWYSDNWYDLGTGFRGTIRSLTLEGFVNSDLFGSSDVTLQEFRDAGYTVLDHTFPISPTPFAQTTAKITANGLKIPLSPEKYYRLTTLQSYQNRSVVLKGTDATGTAMFDEFVFGTGGIQHTYDFYPYISAIIDPRQLALAPPIMSGNISVLFDAASSKISLSWPAATDTDEPLVPPTYQVNISTSTRLDSARWQPEGANLSASFDVTFPNTYAIGVRALDDFDNPSIPLTASWSFPVDYVSVPSQFNNGALLGAQGGAEKITFLATTTANAIDFWETPVRGIYCCSQTYLSVYKDDSSTSLVTGAGNHGEEISSGNPVVTFGPFDSGGEVSYPFSSPITFSPGSYWFAIMIGPSVTTNPTAIYGSGNDSYSGGSWSTSPSQDAYFRIVRTNGP